MTDEDVVRPRLCHKTCGQVHTLARKSFPPAERRRRMQTDADLRGESVRTPVLGESALNIDGARHGLLNTAKSDEEPVPRVINLFAPMTRHQCAQRLIVPPQHV